MTKSLFLLVLLILFFIFIELEPPEKEGFNTYFRQSVRPHIRTIRGIHNGVVYHFNNTFKGFVRSIGLS